MYLQIRNVPTLYFHVKWQSKSVIVDNILERITIEIFIQNKKVSSGSASDMINIAIV